MHAESSIIESIRTFFLTCPFLHDGRVNVDYLGEEMSYSIDPLPCDPVIQKYVDGGKKKQYQFAVCSKEVYDEDARVNIENSGLPGASGVAGRVLGQWGTSGTGKRKTTCNSS